MKLQFQNNCLGGYHDNNLQFLCDFCVKCSKDTVRFVFFLFFLLLPYEIQSWHCHCFILKGVVMILVSEIRNHHVLLKTIKIWLCDWFIAKLWQITFFILLYILISMNAFVQYLTICQNLSPCVFS